MSEPCPILDETPAPPNATQGAAPPMENVAPFPPDPVLKKLGELFDVAESHLKQQATDRAEAMAASVVLKCTARVGHSWHTDPAMREDVKAEAAAIIAVASEIIDDA